MIVVWLLRCHGFVAVAIVVYPDPTHLLFLLYKVIVFSSMVKKLDDDKILCCLV